MKKKKLDKELIILGVVVFFSLVIYLGVETYAHSVMHKTVESEKYEYKDLAALSKTGDAVRGKELVTGAGACTGCHGIESQGMPAPMDALSAAGAYGVNPPDLGLSGVLYEEKFLAELIKNPTKALKVEHKFSADSPHPMPGFAGAGGDLDQEVADMVAYLKSIAPAEYTNKQAFENACARCHDMRYMKMSGLGDTPKFKFEKDTLAHKIKILEYKDHLSAYMGSTPPDLSTIIVARSGSFLTTFIENPQSHKEGTAMPRVGLTEEGATKVMGYLTESGDPAKDARNSLGWKVVLFFIIFTVLAYLWKQSVWRKLH